MSAITIAIGIRDQENIKGIELVGIEWKVASREGFYVFRWKISQLPSERRSFGGEIEIS